MNHPDARRHRPVRSSSPHEILCLYCAWGGWKMRSEFSFKGLNCKHHSNHLDLDLWIILKRIFERMGGWDPDFLWLSTGTGLQLLWTRQWTPDYKLVVGLFVSISCFEDCHRGKRRVFSYFGRGTFRLWGDPETGCPEWRLSWFYLVPPDMLGVSLDRRSLHDHSFCIRSYKRAVNNPGISFVAEL